MWHNRHIASAQHACPRQKCNCFLVQCRVAWVHRQHFRFRTRNTCDYRSWHIECFAAVDLQLRVNLSWKIEIGNYVKHELERENGKKRKMGEKFNLSRKENVNFNIFLFSCLASQPHSHIYCSFTSHQFRHLSFATALWLPIICRLIWLLHVACTPTTSREIGVVGIRCRNEMHQQSVLRRRVKWLRFIFIRRPLHFLQKQMKRINRVWRHRTQNSKIHFICRTSITLHLHRQLEKMKIDDLSSRAAASNWRRIFKIENSNLCKPWVMC